MEGKQNDMTWKAVCALVGINMLYASVGICTKLAAQQDIMSLPYLVWFFSAIIIIGAYALLWQQVLRKIELSTAYLFKGTTLIFTMLIATLLFGEVITIANIAGSGIIIIGISILARA